MKKSNIKGEKTACVRISIIFEKEIHSGGEEGRHRHKNTTVAITQWTWWLLAIAGRQDSLVCSEDDLWNWTCWASLLLYHWRPMTPLCMSQASPDITFYLYKMRTIICHTVKLNWGHVYQAPQGIVPVKIKHFTDVIINFYSCISGYF